MEDPLALFVNFGRPISSPISRLFFIMLLNPLHIVNVNLVQLQEISYLQKFGMIGYSSYTKCFFLMSHPESAFYLGYRFCFQSRGKQLDLAWGFPFDFVFELNFWQFPRKKLRSSNFVTRVERRWRFSHDITIPHIFHTSPELASSSVLVFLLDLSR